MILISASGLGRQYAGDPIFQDLAFEVRSGERIGLVGPNGAGKTTLIKLLAGHEQPDYGSLYVRSSIRVSLLRQQPDFPPSYTTQTIRINLEEDKACQEQSLIRLKRIL